MISLGQTTIKSASNRIFETVENFIQNIQRNWIWSTISLHIIYQVTHVYLKNRTSRINISYTRPKYRLSIIRFLYVLFDPFVLKIYALVTTKQPHGKRINHKNYINATRACKRFIQRDSKRKEKPLENSSNLKIFELSYPTPISIKEQISCNNRELEHIKNFYYDRSMYDQSSPLLDSWIIKLSTMDNVNKVTSLLNLAKTEYHIFSHTQKLTQLILGKDIFCVSTTNPNCFTIYGFNVGSKSSH